jgi:hypothetical protein
MNTVPISDSFKEYNAEAMVYCHRHETLIFHRHLLRPSASLDLANSPEFTAISATLLFPKDDASLGPPLGHKI